MIPYSMRSWEENHVHGGLCHVRASLYNQHPVIDLRVYLVYTIPGMLFRLSHFSSSQTILSPLWQWLVSTD